MPSIDPTRSPTDAPTKECIGFVLDCDTPYDNTFWKYEPELFISYDNSRLYVVDWPNDPFDEFAGLHWVIEKQGSVDVLVSDFYEDDIPRFAMWWKELNLQTLIATHTYHCGLHEIGCHYTHDPTVAPTNPTFEPTTSNPTISPTHCPSVDPTLYPSVPNMVLFCFFFSVNAAVVFQFLFSDHVPRKCGFITEVGGLFFFCFS